MSVNARPYYVFHAICSMLSSRVYLIFSPCTCEAPILMIFSQKKEIDIREGSVIPPEVEMVS